MRTNRWIEEVTRTLLPLSQEQGELSKAMKEWYWDGTVLDVVPDEFDLQGNDPVSYFVSCELCGHYPIRYVYRIENRVTGASLSIGSECYKKFDDSFFKQGYSAEEHLKKVQKMVRERHKELEIHHVHAGLEQIARKKDREFVDSLMDYYDNHGAFTPKQLVMIISLFASMKIGYNPKFFKLKIRRNREKDQMREFDAYAISELWPHLSDSQKRWCRANLNLPSFPE